MAKIKCPHTMPALSSHFIFITSINPQFVILLSSLYTDEKNEAQKVKKLIKE